MAEPALVSIGMPIRNGGKYLELALKSILAQDYSNLEIIVSDNDSSDDTADIVKNYARQDSRITYYKHQNMVPAFDNFTSVLGRAQGQYFMWAAHDDIRSPDYISSLMTAHEKDSGLALAFGDLYVSGTPGDKGQVNKYIFDNNNHKPLTRMWKTANMQCFHIYGLWRTSLLEKIKIHHCTWWPDMPILLAAASVGGFKYVPGPWFSYYEVQKDHQERAEYQDARKNFNRVSGVLELIASSFLTVSSVSGILMGVIGAAFVASKQIQMTIGYIVRRITRNARASRSN